jgi:hypothetical protein
MADRDIRVRFRGDTRDLDAAFGRVRRGADQTDKSVQGVGKSFGALKGAIVASGVLVVGSQVARFTKAMFDLGSSVEETASKFQTTFGSASASVSAFIADFGRMAGVTQSEGQNLLATTGAIAQGFGFAQSASADFAQQIFRTAADMASFNNLPTDDVLNRITAALAGERESMKRLGVVIMETDVQAKAFAQTGKTVAKELTQQEKATATLALITEKAAVAMGDLERTSDSSANVAKKAAGDFRQLKEDISVVIKDALVPLLVKISEVGTSLNENREEVRKWATFFVTAVSGAINIAIQSFERFLAILKIVGGLGQGLGGVFSGNAGAVGVGLQRAGEGVADFGDATARTARELAGLFSAMDRAEAAAESLVPSVAKATGTPGSGGTTSGGRPGKGLLGLAHAAGVANEAHKQLFITLRSNTGRVDSLRLVGDGIEELGVSAGHTMTAWEEMWAANARGLGDAEKGVRSFIDDMAMGVRIALDFGGALGFIGDSSARSINSLVNLAQGVKGLVDAIAAGAATGGHIGAIVGAAGSLLNSAFGGGPSFDDRVSQTMDRLAVSATLLRQDFKRLSDVARQLAAQQTLGPLRQLSVDGRFRDISTDPFSRIGFKSAADPFDDLKSELDRLGLSFLDLKNAADAMGLPITNLLQVLITGKGDMAAATAELLTFLGLVDDLPPALAAVSAATAAAAASMQSAAQSMGSINVRSRFGITNLAQDFQDAWDALLAIGAGSSDVNITGFPAAAMNVNFASANSLQAAITAIQAWVQRAITPAPFVGIDPITGLPKSPFAIDQNTSGGQSALDALQAMKDALDAALLAITSSVSGGFTGGGFTGSGAGASTNPATGLPGAHTNFVQFPAVTEVTAQEWVAIGYTNEFQNRRTADAVEQWLPVMANALTGGQFSQVVSQQIASNLSTGP